MDHFVSDAANILKAGLGVARCGERPSEMVILVGVRHEVEMLAGCDWPLHSIRVHRGARSAYRVSSRGQSVVVEGDQAGRKCRLEEAVANISRLPQFGPAVQITHEVVESMPRLLE